MCNNVALFIAIEPAGGRPVALARVRDANILRLAAAAAVEAAQNRAVEAALRDEMLGVICHEEAQRLRGYLERLVPGVSRDWGSRRL